METVLLIAGGMSFYDALLHSFATAGTGGLSTRALSIGYYNSAYIDIVVGVFMTPSAHVTLYYLILLGNIRTALRNEELRWFLGIIAFAVLTIAVDIRNLYGASAMRCAIRSSRSHRSSLRPALPPRTSTSGRSIPNFCSCC